MGRINPITMLAIQIDPESLDILTKVWRGDDCSHEAGGVSFVIQMDDLVEMDAGFRYPAATYKSTLAEDLQSIANSPLFDTQAKPKELNDALEHFQGKSLGRARQRAENLGHNWEIVRFRM